MTFVVDSYVRCAGHVTTSNPGPSAPLATDWEANAVNHYIHHFVVAPQDELPGMHESLPDLYVRYPQATYLQSAVRAVAMAHLARVLKMGPEYTSIAQSSYGRAIHSLRRALDDDAEKRSTTALMTTELLSEYEVCFPSLPSNPLQVKTRTPRWPSSFQSPVLTNICAAHPRTCQFCRDKPAPAWHAPYSLAAAY